MTWSTLTTLGSDHLFITFSLSSHTPHSPRKAHSYTNFHKADWEGFTSESERRFAETPLPTSCSSGVSSAKPEDTTSPVDMLGITAHLSRMLCVPSSLSEISATPMTSSALPSSHRTGTSSGSFTRKRKTSGGLSWSPSTSPLIPSATGLFCAS